MTWGHKMTQIDIQHGDFNDMLTTTWGWGGARIKSWHTFTIWGLQHVGLIKTCWHTTRGTYNNMLTYNIGPIMTYWHTTCGTCNDMLTYNVGPIKCWHTTCGTYNVGHIWHVDINNGGARMKFWCTKWEISTGSCVPDRRGQSILGDIHISPHTLLYLGLSTPWHHCSVLHCRS